MALTSIQKQDAYQFFIIAFGAPTGVEYMNQLNDAYNAGMTTKQIVNVYTTKPQFEAQYPRFESNEQFAAKLIENVVGASATAEAKAQAVADVIGSLNAGWTKGDVVYQIFTNLAAKDKADPEWGATAQMLENKVAVAAYVTEELGVNTTDLTKLASLIANVTADVASVDAAKAAALGANGETLVLTTGSDDIVGTTGNDKINGSDLTLTVFDEINGGDGTDTLNLVFTDAMLNVAGLEVNSVENVVIKAAASVGEDGAAFDMSGWNGVNTVAITGAGAGEAIEVASAAKDSVTVSAKGVVTLTDTTVAAIVVNTTGDDSEVEVNSGNANVTVTTAGAGANVAINAADAAAVTVTTAGEAAAVVIDAADAGAVTVSVAGSDVALTADSADSVSVTGSAAVNLEVADLGAVTLTSLVEVNDADDATDDELVQITATVTTVANTELNLTLNGADVALEATDSDAGDVETDADLTKLNLTVAAAALGNKLDLTSDTITDITVAGAGNLDLTVDTSVVTDINASAATGNISVTIGGELTSYAGGAGVDTVTLESLPIEALDADEEGTGKFATVIDGGAGDADVLVVNAFVAAEAADLGGDVVTDAFTNAIKGFEVLSLTEVDNEAVNAATFGISYVKLAGDAVGFELTIANEGTVEYTTAATESAIVVAGAAAAAEAAEDDAAAAAAAADFSLNLVLTGGDDGIDIGALTVDNVGVLTLASSGIADEEGEVDVNHVVLEAGAATSLTITGNAGLDLFGTLTALETVAAGSFDAGLAIDVSSSEAEGGVTITTGAGDDFIIGSNQNDTIVAGAGNNTIKGGAGADAITIGTGVNTLVYDAATESTGLTVDVITGFNANDLDADADATAFNTFDLTALLGEVTFLGSVANATLANTALTGTAEVPSANLQVIYVTGENTLYADANGNGTIDAGDLAIQLVGLVGTLTQDNFVAMIP